MRNQATPTIYKGIPMRSRVEAEYAMALDANGIDWQYEPMQYADQTGTYKPDFQVGKHRFVEVKADKDVAYQALQRMHVIRATDPKAELRVVVGTWSGSTYSFRKGDGMTCDNDNPCKECRPLAPKPQPNPDALKRIIRDQLKRISELEAKVEDLETASTIPEPHGPLSFGYDEMMRCPLCHDIHTHIDWVVTFRQQEGKDGHMVCRTSGSFQTEPAPSVWASWLGTRETMPSPPEWVSRGWGNRHLFIFVGYCEGCSGTFGVSFQQHKGSTYVETGKIDKGWAGITTFYDEVSEDDPTAPF